MTFWRWPLYCVATFVLAVFFFRYVIVVPHILALGIAVVVLGALALAFALLSASNGGPLLKRGRDALAAGGWTGGIVGLAFFPSEPSWVWIVAMISLVTLMQYYVTLQRDV